MDYNREVDDALELDEILEPSPALHELLSSLDTTKVKPWILTNAYITHARRVLKLLDIGQFFEGTLSRFINLGITFCDYAQEELICKPKPTMFQKAMIEAGVTEKWKCFFVDDSLSITLWDGVDVS
jgi:pyrimidine and pyridine-specific 5'-nucleotidase